MGGGDDVTTLKVKGGDDVGVTEDGNSLNCPVRVSIVGGGDDVTTLKVKGGDDCAVMEDGNSLNCPIRVSIVGGGDEVTTLKVKGGDELYCDKGDIPLNYTKSSPDTSRIGSKPKLVPILIREKKESISISIDNHVRLTRPSLSLKSDLQENATNIKEVESSSSKKVNSKCIRDYDCLI